MVYLALVNKKQNKELKLPESLKMMVKVLTGKTCK